MLKEAQSFSEQTQTVPPCPKSLLIHLEYFGGEKELVETIESPKNEQKVNNIDILDCNWLGNGLDDEIYSLFTFCDRRSFGSRFSPVSQEKMLRFVTQVATVTFVV